MRADILEILDHTITSMDPRTALRRHVNLIDESLTVGNLNLDLASVDKIVILGGGKAAGAMAEEMECILGDRIHSGQVNILKGTANQFKTGCIKLKEASHPIPGLDNVNATEELMALLTGLTQRDLVLVLISGGGSALMTKPSDDIPLPDLQETTDLLLKAGANIHELNTVRKHTSSIKGGQLSKKSYPATVINLILSDVIGDNLDVIASGPTHPDSTTYSNALQVLKKYRLEDRIPKTVLHRLRQGTAGLLPETPKLGDPIFNKTYSQIIGSVRTACDACSEKVEELGYKPVIVTTELQGEARNVGESLSLNALEVERSLKGGKVALIYGGETTVNVFGDGKGGRNQEVALSASKGLADQNIVLATLGTDGLDGNSDAAGAVVDGETLKRAVSRGLNPSEFLNSNDSYSFFESLDDCIFTDSTGTNVNDITLILIKDHVEMSSNLG